MPSHAVVDLIAATPREGGRLDVRARLACGCVVERTVAADRLIDVAGGRLLVGKLPCPAGHPVRRPGAADRDG